MVVGLARMKKADLIKYIEGLEDTRFENFKLQLNLPYDNEPEWIEYIKGIQTLNTERLKDCKELTTMLELQAKQVSCMIATTGGR
tara:strand:- start:1038 stop:1292 length:255 start_codon:yes stop_codon:yes gene_type:complete